MAKFKTIALSVNAGYPAKNKFYEFFIPIKHRAPKPSLAYLKIYLDMPKWFSAPTSLVDHKDTGYNRQLYVYSRMFILNYNFKHGETLYVHLNMDAVREVYENKSTINYASYINLLVCFVSLQRVIANG